MSLKKQLQNNELTVGSWITLNNPAIAEIMAETGFDWITVDLEHSVIDLFEAENLIRIINLKGVTPLVRLSNNDATQIKRVMDAGSHGVIVPMVNSAVDAQKAVEAVKYPKSGKRGVGLARAQGYGVRFSEYLEWQETESIVIVQIEHIDAVNNLKEILNTDGVDGYIIGPYDLSGSMGIPGEFQDAEFIKTMDYVRATGNEMGKPGGIHIIEPEPEQLETSISNGYKFIAYSLDIRMLDTACRNGLSILSK